MAFLLDNCKFVHITEDVIAYCQQFHCSKDKDIEEFFHDEYKLFERQMFAKSYGFITCDAEPQLVCAFSVSNSLLPVEDFPKEIKNRVNRKVPNSKRKSQHPAVLVGQLAVFDEFAHLGIGDELMDFIKSWFIHPLNKTGCRYILVDANNNDRVLDYYLRNGFIFIFNSVEQEMAYLELDLPPEQKRTRLMYFDLMLLQMHLEQDTK